MLHLQKGTVEQLDWKVSGETHKKWWIFLADGQRGDIWIASAGTRAIDYPGGSLLLVLEYFLPPTKPPI